MYMDGLMVAPSTVLWVVLASTGFGYLAVTLGCGANKETDSAQKSKSKISP